MSEPEARNAVAVVRGAGGGVPIEQPAAFIFDVHDASIAAGRTFFSRDAALEFAHA